MWLLEIVTVVAMLNAKYVCKCSRHNDSIYIEWNDMESNQMNGIENA